MIYLKRKNIFFCILTSIFILAFDFFKFDFFLGVRGSSSFGAEIVYGFLALIPYGLYGILAIWSGIYAFKKYNSMRGKAFIPTTVILITIFLLNFFPYTKLYLNLNYSLNRGRFQQTIQIINGGEIEDYKRNYQLGSEEYIVPYRLASYSGVIQVQIHNDIIKVMFSAYKGYSREVVIVYASDDSGIDKTDFSSNGATCNYSNINKIDVNWYSATISGYTMPSNFYPLADPSADRVPAGGHPGAGVLL